MTERRRAERRRAEIDWKFYKKSLLAGIANRLTEPDHNRSQHA